MKKNRKKRVEEIYPLTPLQQGLMFHSLFAPGSGFYIVQFRLDFQQLNKEAFKRAWQEVIDRHEILRTAFVSEGGKEPLQVVLSEVPLTWQEEDWRAFSPPEAEQKLQAYLEWDRAEDYDFKRAPLMRVALMQIAEGEYHFVWSHHHVLLDGWSVPLLIKEMAAYYEAYCKGEELELARPRPYRDYIAWLGQQDEAEAEKFWREELKGFSAPTKLGIDRGVQLGVAAGAWEFAERRVSLTEELTTALQVLARQEKITLNTIIQGAWALLLSRYSGESRVVFGTTVSGRPAELAGVERMVGMFINTVPLSVEVEQSETVVSWLKRIQQKHVEIRQYEHTPLVKIQSWSEVARGPLFDSILAFANYPVNASLVRQDGDRGLIATSVASVEKPHYPLAVAVTPGPALSLNIRHDCSRYETGAVQQMLVHLQCLLESIVAQAQQPIGQLELLPAAEREQMVVRWNETSAEYPRAMCIHALFEQQVERTPEAIAVIFGEEELSYRELNERANQLAHYLRAGGVSAEQRVGLCVERSLEMVVGMLGVMKAGGGYVPIDPEYPRERVTLMLEDAGLGLLLTQQHLVARLPEHTARVVQLDAEWQEIGQAPATNLAGTATPENLVYMLYTSGSTGRPKGVMVPHRALGNHMAWMQGRFPLTAADRVLQKTPFSFDASVWEFYAPLLAGARLVLAAPGGHQDPAYLVQLIGEQEVTTLQLVPLLLEALLEEPGIAECGSLKRVFCGGEPLTVKLMTQFFEQLGAELINLYGPTEATIDTTYWQCEVAAGRRSIPIGVPVSNTQAYVLDEWQRVVPLGVGGELYLGGESLARGYWQRAELTAERFVPHLYSASAGARLYRTGDMVRWNEAGELEYFGRNDQQVKIRGHRIETGEIETALLERAEVGRAVVLVREEAGRGKQLAAFVMSSNGVEPSGKELRGYLQERMPEYMVPTSIAVVSEVPLMPNGKVDRQALLSLSNAVPESEYEGARNEVEELLAQVWQEVLGIERVGIHDNFFELGGHSLLATQLISRIQIVFQIELPIRTLFDYPVIADLAHEIEATLKGGATLESLPLSPLPRDRELPLSFAQERLWFLDQLEPNNPFYNIFAAVRITGKLNERALERSLCEIVNRHESLRTTFTFTDERPRQQINPPRDASLPIVDLRGEPKEAQSAKVLKLATEEARRPFDLAQGPLLRNGLLRLAEEESVLLLTMHHVVSDGWSMDILIREITALYDAFSKCQPSPLSALPIQYAAFALWQRSW